MTKSLVIVESPSKAKTINKYLGKEFHVVASVGHIKDLPKTKIGIDFENDFEPTYRVIPGKEKVIKELRAAAAGAKTIYIATDPDREGEAIGWHIQEELTTDKKTTKEIYRVMFNEITKNAILESFKHPTELDRKLFDAQQARRLLDRIVGYKVSPLLWDKVRRGLSAGRVQSVALRLIIEREREIEAFVKTEYWTVTANLGAKFPPPFDARLVKVDGKSVKTGEFDRELRPSEIHIQDEATAMAIKREIESQQCVIPKGGITTKEKKRSPVPAFITSKLQQEASRKLRFPVKKTMSVAQKLYEGVTVGSEGAVGLITYMRTDSTRVAESALHEAREFIKEQYGEKSLPAKPIFYKSKKGAQDAHEAIRPTSVHRTPEKLAAYLSKEELALYKLIWQRFVASQMLPAIFDETTIDIDAGPRCRLQAKGMVLKFDGFLAVYEEGKDEKDEEDEERSLKLPPVTEGEVLALRAVTPKQNTTNPPPRYTEATLVKALEENGIGRPSTYAAIMSVIVNRDYVEKLEGKFHPTSLGRIVNDLLVESFADLFNVDYTAKMESELDEIEEGKMGWTAVLKEFYDRFTRDLAVAEQHMRDIKRQEIPTGETCDKCGSPMVKKFGRFGEFIACSNYPECKNTREANAPAAPSENGEEAENPYANEKCDICDRPMALKRGRFGAFLACTGYPDCKNTRKIMKGGRVAEPEVKLDERCPDCGANLVVKHGRFGKFIACSTYPKCKYIKKETLGIACPREGCEGELMTRKSRFGKAFYGCTKYPGCNFVVWQKPIAQPCPKCGAPFVLEKTTKRDGTVRLCQKEECAYKESVESAGAPPPPSDESKPESHPA